MKMSDGLLFLLRADVTMKESCAVSVPEEPEWRRGLSERRGTPLPAPWLMKLCVMLSSVLSGWRQGSLGTEESQLEESKSE